MITKLNKLVEMKYILVAVEKNTKMLYGKRFKSAINV